MVLLRDMFDFELHSHSHDQACSHEYEERQGHPRHRQQPTSSSSLSLSLDPHQLHRMRVCRGAAGSSGTSTAHSAAYVRTHDQFQLQASTPPRFARR